jgi:nicotinate-nucleotide pyrophosphorylase (carboxylating)
VHPAVNAAVNATRDLPELDPAELDRLIGAALAEDLDGAGDVTSEAIVDADRLATARILAKSHGILAGAPVADRTFKRLDPSVEIEWLASEGGHLEPGEAVARLHGLARPMMAAERVALNFMQHMSGVATLTAAFVSASAGHPVKILCTRKTLPGLRAVERYAVAAGGGSLHRAGLFDAILIKTNHSRISGGILEAVRRAKAASSTSVEVEVRNLGELEDAIAAGADWALLDNADVETIRGAVALAKGRAGLEISGGVSLDSVGSIAALGPDAISVGKLTHSASAVDMALQVLEED